MAADLRTTYGPSANVTAEQINIAYGYFTPQNVIRASHFTYLRDLINLVCGHSHGLVDYYTISTFGNTGSTTYGNDATEGAGITSTLSTPIGSVIYASHANQLIDSINTVRTHAHGWTDN